MSLLVSSEFPALSRLRLTAEEIELMHGQGFVVSEQRRGRRVYKLRYRADGRQRARYIGPDASVAEQVEKELHELQQNRQGQRQLAALSRAAGRRLREAKCTLMPALKAQGFHFHGQAIRRRHVLKLRHKTSP